MTSLEGFRIRAARMDDLDALYTLAVETGGGLTNLPPDRDGLIQRLENSEASYAANVSKPGNENYILVLEETASRQVIGTSCLFAQLGVDWPFYSFRLARLSQTNRELRKIHKYDVLMLVNDFDGAAEVGGLYLAKGWRQSGSPRGLGRLLARSRYLFVAASRERFPERIVAELRGYVNAHGLRPFWEALGRHFFDMPFDEADRYNSLYGNQFIADLMPTYPFYVQLLPHEAQAVIGRPHDNSVPAYKLLQAEGFRYHGYVDIFDAGPTVESDIDQLKAVRDRETAALVDVAQAPDGITPMLIATGVGRDYRATVARIWRQGYGVCIEPAAAMALDVEPGEELAYAPF